MNVYGYPIFDHPSTCDDDVKSDDVFDVQAGFVVVFVVLMPLLR
jgi:hypothetical protein